MFAEVIHVFCRPSGTGTFFCASFPSDKSLDYYQKSLRDNVLLNDVKRRICVVQRGRCRWAFMLCPFGAVNNRLQTFEVLRYFFPVRFLPINDPLEIQSALAVVTFPDSQVDCRISTIRILHEIM